MVITATDVKNNFGKMLKLLEYEDIIVKKNGRVVAKIVKHSEPLDPMNLIKESIPEYVEDDRKVTYEEFLKLVASSDNRYELIDGQVYLQASPRVTHQNIVADMIGQMYPYFSGKECRPFVSPYDITLKVDHKTNVVQPDLGVICDVENVDEKDRYVGMPTLVVEVLSKSSFMKDTLTKLNLYVLSGIKEYWIIDPYRENSKIYSIKDYEITDYREFQKEEFIESFQFEGLKVTW